MIVQMRNIRVTSTNWELSLRHYPEQFTSFNLHISLGVWHNYYHLFAKEEMEAKTHEVTIVFQTQVVWIQFDFTALYTCSEPTASVPVWQVSFHSRHSTYIILLNPHGKHTWNGIKQRQDYLHLETEALKFYTVSKWKWMPPTSVFHSLLWLQHIDLI